MEKDWISGRMKLHEDIGQGARGANAVAGGENE